MRPVPVSKLQAQGFFAAWQSAATARSARRLSTLHGQLRAALFVIDQQAARALIEIILAGLEHGDCVFFCFAGGVKGFETRLNLRVVLFGNGLPDFNNSGIVMHGRYQIRHAPFRIAFAIWERLYARKGRIDGMTGRRAHGRFVQQASSGNHSKKDGIFFQRICFPKVQKTFSLQFGFP